MGKSVGGGVALKSVPGSGLILSAAWMAAPVYPSHRAAHVVQTQ